MFQANPMYISTIPSVKRDFVINDGINLTEATQWTPSEVYLNK